MKVKPWMWLPAQTAHKWSPLFLSLYKKISSPQTLTWKPMTWREIEFTNPLGIAGGMDKDADHIHSWWNLGPGFIEVGTVTPKSQEGHPGKTMDRNISSKSLWNHMGFPSKGVEHVLSKIKPLYQPHFTPIFVNIGKNHHTPLDMAHMDYIQCIQKLEDYADAFVLNVSSPNTEQLKDLLKAENLSKFLKPIVESCHSSSSLSPPLLLKISPDLSEEQLQSVLTTSLDLGLDGWIFTNTTSASTSVSTSTSSKSRASHGASFPSQGGISGLPLANLSKKSLRFAVSFLGEKKQGKLLVSCGGVMEPKDVMERLEMGANLVQVYSALVFHGPFFFRQVAQYMKLQI